MTKVVVNPNLPFFDRDSFLTPFDKMFDQMIETQFPSVVQQVGVKPYQGSAYPKVATNLVHACLGFDEWY